MKQSVLRARDALLVVALSFLALITVGAQLNALFGTAGILVSELLLVAGPALLWLRLQRVPRQQIGAGRARALTLAGGLLAGAGAFYVSAVLESTLYQHILPVPDALREQMKRLISPSSGPRPLAVDLVVLALAPAACEELLFRGLLLSSLLRPDPRSRARQLAAIAVAALLFGAFHGSIYKLLPAAVLGLGLGLVRVTSASLWPPIAFHAVNNLLVVVAVRAGRDEPLQPTSTAGALALAIAVVALTAGIGLATLHGVSRAVPRERG